MKSKPQTLKVEMPSNIFCPYCMESIGKPHEDRVARELEQHYWKHRLEELTNENP